MRRVVEYPFRRRTTVRQRRISAREKVNTVKRRKPASGFPAFLKIDISESFSFHKCLYPIKTFTFSLFRSALFGAAKWVAQKRCRIVEYPFRRRTTVRQRRISAREKVNTIKRRQPASGLPAFIISILSKSSDFHKCLCPIKTFPFHFFGLHFFSIP